MVRSVLSFIWAFYFYYFFLSRLLISFILLIVIGTQYSKIWSSNFFLNIHFAKKYILTRISISNSFLFGVLYRWLNSTHVERTIVALLECSIRRFLSSPLDEPHANYLLSESAPNGVSYNFKTWRTLNRIRIGALIKTNLIKWNLAQPTDDKWDSEMIQDMEHLPSVPHTVTWDNLCQSKPEALNVVQYCAEKLLK